MFLGTIWNVKKSEMYKNVFMNEPDLLVAYSLTVVCFKCLLLQTHSVYIHTLNLLVF